MNAQDVIREMMHEQATDERIRMVRAVQRKRVERERTLSRRLARQTKNFMTGRVS